MGVVNDSVFHSEQGKFSFIKPRFLLKQSVKQAAVMQRKNRTPPSVREKQRPGGEVAQIILNIFSKSRVF